MQSLADNPAVTEPRKALTRMQAECLTAVDFYAHQRPLGRFVQLGQKRFSVVTLLKLRDLGLVSRPDSRNWKLTQAGAVALERLKGKNR